MTPSIDLRLATIIRAMRDVVSPAIDRDNSLAQEQAALVIGHLQLLAVQWSRTNEYANVCLTDLAGALRALSPEGGPQTMHAATALFAALDCTAGAREARYKAVMAGADQLIRAADVDGGEEFGKQLRQAMLAFSKRQSLRDRSWFALSGFDLRPGELLSIESLAGGELHDG